VIISVGKSNKNSPVLQQKVKMLPY